MTVDLPPGPHGGEGPRLAARLGIDPTAVLDLSQSLNPAAPDPRPVVERHLDALGTYPDPTAATERLAAAIGIDPGRVLLTNGGSEAIALVATHLGRGWVDEPDFSLYRRHIPELDRDGPRFRSNPHSPSGLLADPHDAAAVWDEAFFPTATGAWTRGDAERGAWVVGSLTKLFACPGLRMGYLLAPDAAALVPVRDRQPEWSVSSLACRALPDLLDATDLPVWRDRTTALRSRLADLLRAHQLEPRPSDASWLLVDAPHLRAALAPHAIAVRSCASFGLPDVVRIAVPDEAGLDRLAGALTALAGRAGG